MKTLRKPKTNVTLDINKLTIKIEKDEDGIYVAEIIELPGCYTQAKTLEQLFKRIPEAIQAYIEEIE